MHETKAKDPFAPGRPSTVDKDLIVSQRLAGKRVAEVAREVGVSPRRVQQIVQEWRSANEKTPAAPTTDSPGH